MGFAGAPPQLETQNKHMKHVLRWCAALVALALALPAQAAKQAEVLSSYGITSWYNSDGSAMASNGGGGTGNPANVFDGNFENYQMFPRAGNNGYVIIDLSQNADAPAGGYKVTEVKVGARLDYEYSIYITTDGSSWTLVEGADHAKNGGTYSVGALATQVKYVFNSGSMWDYSTQYLAEIQVLGYDPTPPPAQVISSYGITSWYNSDGSAMASNGGGGTGNPANVFDGNFENYQMFPRAGNNGYVIIDLSQNADAPAAGYMVTEVKVGARLDYEYSIYITTDGSSWTLIDGADHAKNGGTYSVNALAKQVKYVFNSGSMWDYSTQYLAEIQVLGIDPADIDCVHPSWTAWTAVANSNSCTERGIDERFCTVCGERQTKLSDSLPPLGHDYHSHLTQAGTINAYGNGYVDCSRCDFRINFSDPIDLSTLGGLAMQDLVQFTDITVSSTFHQEWGPNPIKLYDGQWTWDNNVGFWLSSEYEAMSDSHVDYHFGAAVDLTAVEISVHNHNQTLLFYDVDDATGEETLLAEQVVVEDTSDGAAGYQRMTIPAYAGTCTHLRLRTTNDDGYSLWNYRPCMLVIEMRPYGTIAGANKLKPAVRIGLDGYESIADAIAAVETNAASTATITLMETRTEDVVIPANKNITIDLNGNSITNVASDTISVYGTLSIMDLIGGGEVVATGANKAVSVANGGSATLSAGTFRGGVEAADGESLAVAQGCLFDASVPLAYCPDGFMCSTTPNEAGLYSIVQRTIPTSATATEEEQAAATAANARVYNDRVQAQFPASNDSGALAFVRVYAEDGSFVTLRTSDGAQTIDTTKLGGAPSRIVAFYGDQVTATEGVDAPALVEEPEVVVENGAVSVNLSVPVVSGLYYAIVDEDGAVLSAINGGAAVSPSDDGVAKPATVTPSAADWGVQRFKIQAQDVPFNQN